ncbi:MAG: hypothetical protein KGN79_03385 [Acidobacteriota bacterium]|nr:hypothetical protein [Acidobacteriota bacterium]
MCSHCHAVMGQDTRGDWCPACGGAVVERDLLVESAPESESGAVVDHRGIELPRRHAVGGIITPQ